MFFPTIQEIVAIHQRSIEEFGGIGGIREMGALESAVLAAEQRAYYEEANLVLCSEWIVFHQFQERL